MLGTAGSASDDAVGLVVMGRGRLVSEVAHVNGVVGDEADGAVAGAAARERETRGVLRWAQILGACARVASPQRRLARRFTRRTDGHCCARCAAPAATLPASYCSYLAVCVRACWAGGRASNRSEKELFIPAAARPPSPVSLSWKRALF
jgi:hypothetical protein